MDERRRVARRGDQLLRGVGIASDVNGPFRLRFRIVGIDQPVTLNTREWSIEWEDEPAAPEAHDPQARHRELLAQLPEDLRDLHWLDLGVEVTYTAIWQGVLGTYEAATPQNDGDVEVSRWERRYWSGEVLGEYPGLGRVRQQMTIEGPIHVTEVTRTEHQIRDTR